MNTQTIQAEARAESGKGIAHKLRAAGRIPAVAYGSSVDSQKLSLDPKVILDLRKGHLGWNQPIAIEVDGGDNVALAILSEVQRHPVSGKVLHADFLCIDEGSDITVKVPLRLIGKAPGEALGGRISQPKRDLEVHCTPTTIPSAIEIDISALNVGDRILFSELPVPKGVRVSLAFDAPAVSCVGRRGGPDDDLEEEEAAAEGGEAAEGSEGDEAAEGGKK
jgi:large subunit ribosomal protein L25